MNNINIVTGAPLTGKTQYIKSNFSDPDKYYILDYGKILFELFGTYQDEDFEKDCDVRNKMTEDLFEYYYFGEHEIVFEFCTGFEETDKGLMEIIKLIKAKNIKVNLIELTCSVEEATTRNELVRSDPTYYSSYHLNQEFLEYFPHFLGDIGLTNDLYKD